MTTTTEKKKSDFYQNLTTTEINVDSKDRALAEKVCEQAIIPTTKNEYWKYTRLTKLTKPKYIQQKEEIGDITSFVIDQDAFTLVFVNGFFNEDLSSKNKPSGVEFKILSEKEALPPLQATIEGALFTAINTKYLCDGVELVFKEKNQVKTPVQILHIIKGENTISNFRVLVKNERFSEGQLILGEFSEGGKTKLSNIVVDFKMEEQSKLHVDKIQFEDEETFHISTENIRQKKNSQFTINTITLNGALVRNNLNFEVKGENCESNLNGAYLLKGKQHVDNHTVVDHQVAHCNSNELYKGVIYDKGTAVFNGKVFVRQDAQKINAFQSNGNVLMSDYATVNSKPELEIYADDVKCSHGSTTGQLDEEAVFYLRTRGISEDSARELLIAAFIDEVLDMVQNENIRTFIDKIISARFHQNI